MSGAIGVSSRRLSSGVCRGQRWTAVTIFARQLSGASCLCGIAFAMLLFIATRSFREDRTLVGANLAIVAAAFVAGLDGYFVLSRC